MEDGKNEIPNLVESNDELAHCWKFYILAVIMLVAYTLGHGTLNRKGQERANNISFLLKKIKSTEIAMSRNPNRSR